MLLKEFQEKQQILSTILELKEVPQELEVDFDYFYCDPCKYHAGKKYDACDEVSCFKAWASGNIGLVVECLQEHEQEKKVI